MSLPTERYGVTIVGAGPVGLLLACELGRRGVPVLVIEERLQLLRHPKANTQSARSMEIYRKLGISRQIRDNGLPSDRRTDVGYFTQLFGRELFRVPLPTSAEAEAMARTGDPRWLTPEPQFRMTQMALEPVLLERARSFPSVKIRFGWRAAALAQDDRGVALTIEDAENGEQRVVKSDYLAGCDGGKSFVRKSLGIRFLGEGGLEMHFLGGRMLATYFRAPALLERFPHADTWMHWVMQPAGRSILLVIDPAAHEFLVHFQLKPDENVADVDFPARLTAILGESVPHEVISSAEWRAGMGLVAERYSAGRCFLVGDAIHLFTPTGGFGLNTGIEDAFNLGWKLAMVCNGIADAAMLDSYEIERRPVGLRNTGYALQLAQSNGRCPVSPALDDEGPEGEAARAATIEHLRSFAWREFDTPGIQLGARYDQSPLIIKEEASIPPDSPTEYSPSGIPGGRLPHVWLQDGTSLFDRLGRDFTLISLGTNREADAWATAAAEIDVELTILHLNAEATLADILGADYILVRPDQHIAWRGGEQTEKPEQILRTALGYGMSEGGAEGLTRIAGENILSANRGGKQ